MATDFHSAPPPSGAPRHDAPAPASPGRSDPLPFWVLGGGAAIFGGSLLPFVSVSVDGLFSINVMSPGARVLSALFGLVVAGLGAAMKFGPAAGRRGLSIAALGCGAAGVLGYSGFILLGLHGINVGGSLGLPAEVTYSPSIGVLLALAGCTAAAVAALNVVLAVARRTS